MDPPVQIISVFEARNDLFDVVRDQHNRRRFGNLQLSLYQPRTARGRPDPCRARFIEHQQQRLRHAGRAISTCCARPARARRTLAGERFATQSLNSAARRRSRSAMAHIRAAASDRTGQACPRRQFPAQYPTRESRQSSPTKSSRCSAAARPDQAAPRPTATRARWLAKDSRMRFAAASSCPSRSDRARPNAGRGELPIDACQNVDALLTIANPFTFDEWGDMRHRVSRSIRSGSHYQQAAAVIENPISVSTATVILPPPYAFGPQIMALNDISIPHEEKKCRICNILLLIKHAICLRCSISYQDCLVSVCNLSPSSVENAGQESSIRPTPIISSR